MVPMYLQDALRSAQVIATSIREIYDDYILTYFYFFQSFKT